MARTAAQLLLGSGTASARVLGQTEPRLWTPPLRELTPETSYGFAVIEFARYTLRTPLDPWEEWAVIHMGELLPDGRPRFREVLIVVARQNGKTFLMRVLCLFWQFIEQWPMTVSTGTTLGLAKETWQNIIGAAKDCEDIRDDIEDIRSGTGLESFIAAGGCQHKPFAANKRAARSLSVDRALIDELRMHNSFDAWNAITKAANARPFAQIVCITNQGDDTSVVLDSLRNQAMAFIKTGDPDKYNPRLGLFEWSVPDGASPLDLHALAMANPNMNRVGEDGMLRMDGNDLLNQGKQALKAGGEEEATHRIEVMCERVRSLDGAIDEHAWADSFVEGDLSNLADRVAFLDMSWDRRHITLMGGGRLADGRIRVETIREWFDTNTMRAELPGLLRGSGGRPPFRSFGVIPGGPAATVMSEFRRRPGVWPIPGVKMEEVTSERAEICMALADMVESGYVVHSSAPDDMLTTQVTGAVKKRSGDRWVFDRVGVGNCDAAYATAGVVHLVRNIPAAPKITKTHALRGI